MLKTQILYQQECKVKASIEPISGKSVCVLVDNNWSVRNNPLSGNPCPETALTSVLALQFVGVGSCQRVVALQALYKKTCFTTA